MDKETQILIDALTTGLERCEGTITRLFVLLGRAGLADDFVTGAVHERQQASLKLVLKARGNGIHPAIVPMAKLCVPLESEKPRIRGFSDESLTMSNDDCGIVRRTSDRSDEIGENVADDRS